MRYITNGQSFSQFEDRGHPPAGCRFINENEYHAAMATDTAGYEARRAEYTAQREALRQSAKANLMAGTPLTAEEADAFLG